MTPSDLRMNESAAPSDQRRISPTSELRPLLPSPLAGTNEVVGDLSVTAAAATVAVETNSRFQTKEVKGGVYGWQHFPVLLPGQSDPSERSANFGSSGLPTYSNMSNNSFFPDPVIQQYFDISYIRIHFIILIFYGTFIFFYFRNTNE